MITLILLGLAVLFVVLILLCVALATPVAFILLGLLILDVLTMSLLFRRRKHGKED